jgi:CheY-like chemotaxis protein
MIEFDKDQIEGMKVLIVDDVIDNLSILGHFLQQSGLEISVASTGEKAFELIDQNKPDLILLDIRMPGLDGFEVCKKLKADVSTKDIAVIFITAMTGTEDMMRGFNAGGVDYIVKPFQEREVVCRITTQLKLKKAQDEIKRKEKFYRVIVESVPDLIFQLCPDRKIMFANPAFRLLGYDPNKLVGQPIGNLIESSDKERLLEDLATKNVGPMAITDLEVVLKVSDDVSLVEEMSTHKVLVDSVGLWNVSDEDVFKENVDKKFLGTLCIGKKAV